MRKILLALVAIPVLALGLAACDDGTYTVGTHSTLGKVYDLRSRDGFNNCTMAQGSQSFSGARFVAYSDPARNGQQFGLINCDVVDYGTYNYALYPKGGLMNFIGDVYFVAGVEIPYGAVVSPTGENSLTAWCKVRYWTNGHPGAVNAVANAWTTYYIGATFTIPQNTNIKGIEFRGTNGSRCEVNRVGAPNGSTNPPWV